MFRKDAPILAVMIVGALAQGCGGPQVDAHIPEVGSLAPDFVLPNADGRPVSLASFTRPGPLVIVFHRGHW